MVDFGIKYLGKEFENKLGEKCFVIDYKSSKEVVVMFYDGYYTTTQMSNIRKGAVKNPFSEQGKFLGFGVADVKVSTKSPLYKYRRLWEAMITRVHSKADKAYHNVTVSQDWAMLSTFLEDIKSFSGYDRVLTDGWVLDKDILSVNDKIYSKDTCCFVPPEINSLLVNMDKPKGNHPLGVHFCNREGKFVAQMHTKTTTKHIGYFSCPSKAHTAYKCEKQQYINRIVELYKDALDTKVYRALLNCMV